MTVICLIMKIKTMRKSRKMKMLNRTARKKQVRMKIWKKNKRKKF